MSAAQIHLSKTLYAMRWIALLHGRTESAEAIEIDMSKMLGRKK